MEEKKDKEVEKSEAILILDSPESNNATVVNNNQVDDNLGNKESIVPINNAPIVAEKVSKQANTVPQVAVSMDTATTSNPSNKKKDETKKEKKKMDRTTLLCWIGICICSVFIALPPLFKIAFKGPEIMEEPTTKSITTLFCAKSEGKETYLLKRGIKAIYENADLIELKMIYTIIEISGSEAPAISEITFDEITTFKKMIGGNVKLKETEKEYEFTFDYINGNFNNIAELSDHGKIAAIAIQEYQSLGFRCERTTETVDLK